MIFTILHASRATKLSYSVCRVNALEGNIQEYPELKSCKAALRGKQ